MRQAVIAGLVRTPFHFARKGGGQGVATILESV
jgi:hypothetical protein